jgi:hypothetical protein
MSHSHETTPHSPTDPRYLKALGRDEKPAAAGFTQGLDFAVIGLTGTVSGLLLVSILVATHGWYLKVSAEEQAMKGGNPSGAALTVDGRTTNSIRQEQKEALSKYAVVNKDLGIVRLPIDQAMKQFVASGGTACAVVPPPAK